MTEVKNCETTAAGLSAVPSKRVGSFGKAETVAKNPINPIKTAACIRCLRKFSFDFAKNPKTARIKPKTAGIKAVTTLPAETPGASVATAYPKPPKPTKINKTPQIIATFGIN